MDARVPQSRRLRDSRSARDRCSCTLLATEAHGDEHLAKADGCSLHAGVWAAPNDRTKLEKRVFQIDISQCEQCGGKVKIIGRSCASCARGIRASMHTRRLH